MMMFRLWQNALLDKVGRPPPERSSCRSHRCLHAL